jgi:hypothetical protein
MIANWRRLIAPVLLAAGAALTPTFAIAAGGAYAVDDSEVGKPGDCKVETWASFASNRDQVAVTKPACVFNLGVPVEINVPLMHQRSGGDSTTTAGIGDKVALVPVETGHLGVGLSAGTAWQTSDGRNTGGYVSVPLTYQVSDALRFNINGGYQYDGLTRLSYASFGAGFEWKFAQPLTLIGEVYGIAGSRGSAERSLTEPRAQIGLRFTPVDRVDLDLIYGRNINGENANWITVGVNLRF